MIAKEVIIDKLKKSLNSDNYIIGSVIGSGISFLNAVNAGVDFAIVLSSGKYRQMGRGSLASFLCYENSNDLVMNIGTREILSLSKKTPIFFGLNATDPTKDLYSYIKEIKEAGFSGINNFPSVGLIDGVFRQNLEETGMGYGLEVEMIRKAHELDMLTIPYVFDEYQAEEMAKAGADILVAHMDLTTKGTIGAKTVLTLDGCIKKIEKIIEAGKKVNPNILVICHGGPIAEPADAEYVIKNTKGINGFFGASSIERFAAEKEIKEQAAAFKEITK